MAFANNNNSNNNKTNRAQNRQRSLRKEREQFHKKAIAAARHPKNHDPSRKTGTMHLKRMELKRHKQSDRRAVYAAEHTRDSGGRGVVAHIDDSIDVRMGEDDAVTARRLEIHDQQRRDYETIWYARELHALQREVDQVMELFRAVESEQERRGLWIDGKLSAMDTLKVLLSQSRS